MTHQLWGLAVQWVVWVLMMAAVMALIGSSRQRKRPESEARQLVHPLSTLVVGVAGFGLFTCIAILSGAFVDETTSFITALIFGGFAALSLPMILDYYMSRHEVSEEGMSYGSLTGRRGSLRWSEVAQVRYSPSMKWFRLQTQSGDVARISAMLMGLPEFARLVLAHVPPAAVDAETLVVLQATAEGNPPEVWG